jgi:hypothetical protein
VALVLTSTSTGTGTGSSMVAADSEVSTFFEVPDLNFYLGLMSCIFENYWTVYSLYCCINHGEVSE